MTNLDYQVKKFKERYPDRIAIIINPTNNKQPSIDKRKYLVNKDMLMGEFVYSIKNRIQINKTEALFIFIKEDKILPTMTQTVGEIFNRYQKEDILNLEYSLENTFG